MRRFLSASVPVLAIALLLGLTFSQAQKADDAALGSRKYSDYSPPKLCGTSCHTDIYQQWTQAMMSQAYTHHWDEIEYFKLAVPHAGKDPIVAGIKADGNGCHAPIAFLAGADATLEAAPFELNLQYVERKDDNPFFSLFRPTEITTRGGFAELVFRPRGDNGRWYAVGLLNIVDSGQVDLKSSAATLHAGYLLRRNLRATAEVT